MFIKKGLDILICESLLAPLFDHTNIDDKVSNVASYLNDFTTLVFDLANFCDPISDRFGYLFG